MTAIERLLNDLGIKAPAVSTASQVAPVLIGDYHIRVFARQAAQRIARKFNLDEDDVFWMILDEDPNEGDDPIYYGRNGRVAAEASRRSMLRRLEEDEDEEEENDEDNEIDED